MPKTRSYASRLFGVSLALLLLACTSETGRAPQSNPESGATVAAATAEATATRVPPTATAEPTATPDPPTPTATPVSFTDQFVVKELGAYRTGGTTWKNLLIVPGLNDGNLTGLARELHRRDPGSAYRFFDDEAQFQAFMAWDINYPNPRYPFPEAWTNRHHVGNVQQMLEGGRMRWGLWQGAGFRKIAALD